MADWILLIPPSESKASVPAQGSTFEQTRQQARYNAFKELDPCRARVMDAVDAALQRGTALDLLFELSGEALDEALQINRRIRTAATLPARDLYTGVLYEALQYHKLKPAEKKLFDTKTLIFSGMFGLLRPTDCIPPYKLKMSANLGGAVGKLTQFWRRPVTEILRREVRGKVVWDLLPDLHQRVWDGSGEYVARHQVKFVKRVVRDGIAEYKTISHHSKSLKGALIRHLLQKNAREAEAMEDFEHKDGYRFNDELSVVNSHESMLVFSAD